LLGEFIRYRHKALITWKKAKRNREICLSIRPGRIVQLNNCGSDTND